MGAGCSDSGQRGAPLHVCALLNSTPHTRDSRHGDHREHGTDGTGGARRIERDERVAAPRRDESPAAYRRGRSDLHYNDSPRFERAEAFARSAQHVSHAYHHADTAVTEPEIDLVHKRRADAAGAPAAAENLGILASDLHADSSARVAPSAGEN